jgi:hypothetical protein
MAVKVLGSIGAGSVRDRRNVSTDHQSRASCARAARAGPRVVAEREHQAPAPSNWRAVKRSGASYQARCLPPAQTLHFTLPPARLLREARDPLVSHFHF